MEKKQGSPIVNRDLWQDLHALLKERQAPPEWIKVPSHVGLYGNAVADGLADLGAQRNGVRMQGQEQLTLKRQAERVRDKGDQELGSQGLAPLMAAMGGAPRAGAEGPHTGGGVQRLMFVTYVNIEGQCRDERHRYAVFLAQLTEALALRLVEEEDWRQLMSHMHYMHRQGLQWEWYGSCKGMLEGWEAEWRRLKLQALEQ